MKNKKNLAHLSKERSKRQKKRKKEKSSLDLLFDFLGMVASSYLEKIKKEKDILN
jgi:hypothetical protein